jgi:hypothetical protein
MANFAAPSFKQILLQLFSPMGLIHLFLSVMFFLGVATFVIEWVLPNAWWLAKSIILLPFRIMFGPITHVRQQQQNAKNDEALVLARAKMQQRLNQSNADAARATVLKRRAKLPAGTGGWQEMGRGQELGR